MTTELATQYKPGQAELVLIDPTSKGGKPSISMVRHTESGMVRFVRTRIVLDPKLDHVYKLTKREEEIPSITATGYDQINKAMGVSRYIPDTMMGPDGQIVPNPHILRDGHDSIYRVTYKIVGIGRNAVGNWLMITTVLPYDLGTMFAQDLMKKWRKWAGKDKPKQLQKWGRMFAEDKIPDDPFPGDDTPIQIVKLPSSHIMGSNVLVIQLKDEVLDVIDEHITRMKFATRNAETIAWRRILKVFAAQNKVDPKTMSVTVTAWVQADRKGMSEIRDIVEQVESGGFVIDGQEILTQSSSDEITLDDEQESLGGRLDADDPSQDDDEPIDAGIEETQPKPAKAAKKRADKAAVESEPKSIGDSELYKKINNAFVKLTPDQKDKISKKWKFKWMKEVKEFGSMEAEDLLIDIESEKGSAS